jgi:predicted phosphodiesterase
MYAVISDIHGNLEALEAVLEEIRRLGANRIICLGDLVCYGPDSIECIRKSRDWDVVVAGDWDEAMLTIDENRWSPWAYQHASWIRDEIRRSPKSSELLRIINSYQDVHFEGRWCFAHGTPLDQREFIFPEHVHEPKMLDDIAEQFDHFLVCGHSHMSGVFTRTDNAGWQFVKPTENHTYELTMAEKVIVMTGSVGQPRDADCRAAFLTVEANSFQFHRVEYDVSKTIEKILAISEIDDMQGRRLLDGR